MITTSLQDMSRPYLVAEPHVTLEKWSPKAEKDIPFKTLEVGDRVELIDLTCSKQLTLNENQGILMSFDSLEGLWLVKIVGYSRMEANDRLAVKPEAFQHAREFYKVPSTKIVKHSRSEDDGGEEELAYLNGLDWKGEAAAEILLTQLLAFSSGNKVGNLSLILANGKPNKLASSRAWRLKIPPSYRSLVDWTNFFGCFKELALKHVSVAGLADICNSRRLTNISPLVTPAIRTATSALTQPLTAIYALFLKHGIEKLSTWSDSLIIHIAGSENELFEGYGGEEKWLILRSVMPSVSRIRIVYIGPKVVAPRKHKGASKELLRHRLKESLISVTYETGLYHEYYDRNNNKGYEFDKPSLFLAQNCGVHAAEYRSSWMPTMELLNKIGQLVCLTTFDYFEMKRTVAMLGNGYGCIMMEGRIASRSSVLFCGHNPYAALGLWKCHGDSFFNGSNNQILLFDTAGMFSLETLLGVH
jgi:hypothetical protein